MSIILACFLHSVFTAGKLWTKCWWYSIGTASIRVVHAALLIGFVSFCWTALKMWSNSCRHTIKTTSIRWSGASCFLFATWTRTPFPGVATRWRHAILAATVGWGLAISFRILRRTIVFWWRLDVFAALPIGSTSQRFPVWTTSEIRQLTWRHWSGTIVRYFVFVTTFTVRTYVNKKAVD